MLDINAIAKALRQAAMLSRATPGRQGLVVYPHQAEEVLVAGDLHGNLVNLRQILKQAALEHHPRRHLVLQELIHGKGRYPGGGCMSHQAVDVAAMLKQRYPDRVHILPGNHELSDWTGRAIQKDGEELLARFAGGVAEAYGDRAAELLDLYHELFRALPVALLTANRVLITHTLPDRRHAAAFDEQFFAGTIRADEPHGPQSRLHQWLWGRELGAETAALILDRLNAVCAVTGHIPCDQGYATPHARRLIVDCVDRPAACVLFRTDEPMTIDRLVAGLMYLT